MPYLQVAAKNVAREANRKHHAAKRDVSRTVDLDAKSLNRMPARAAAEAE